MADKKKGCIGGIVGAVAIVLVIGAIGSSGDKDDESTIKTDKTSSILSNSKKEESIDYDTEDLKKDLDEIVKDVFDDDEEITEEKKPLELVDSGYYFEAAEESYSYNHINYAVEIKNPNENYAITFPTIRITARSADGTIIKTEDMVLNSIAAGDSYKYGNYVAYQGEEPDTIEITVENDDNDYRKQNDSSYVNSDQLEVFNVSEVDDTFGIKFTGEVTNKSDKDLNMVCVNVIFKSGDKIIGGESTYVDDLSVGKTMPFEISTFISEPFYDSYEVVAIQW